MSNTITCSQCGKEIESPVRQGAEITCMSCLSGPRVTLACNKDIIKVAYGSMAILLEKDEAESLARRLNKLIAEINAAPSALP